jgi:WhiB family redox-sensing transcriptional regulator
MASLHHNWPIDDGLTDNRQTAGWPDQQWLERAACKGKTTLFFGIAGERPERRVRREAAARKVCATCPALHQCRAVARANRENGFWGGESEEERAAAGFPPRSISRRAVQEAAAGGLAS